MSLTTQLMEQAVLTYSVRLPYHPGKWRVTDWLLKRTGVGRKARGATRVARRGGVVWKLGLESWVERTLYFHGDWDTYDVNFLVERLVPGSVFLDVGSCFGYYALTVARQIGPRAQVYAFEALGANYRRIVENVELNGFTNVQPVHLAMGAESGVATFELPPADNLGRGHLASGATGANVESVQVSTLDQWCEQQQLTRVDAIKVDVEGMEVDVLAGARDVLKRFRPHIVIELDPSALRRQGREPEEVLEALWSAGYRTHTTGKAGLQEFTLQTLHSSTELERGYINLVCSIHR